MKNNEITRVKPIVKGAHDAKNEIINWLHEAYAMERALEKELQKQAENEDMATEIRRHAASHLRETRRHAEDVESVLHSLDPNPARMKTASDAVRASKVLKPQTITSGRVQDLIVAYSMEHFEIACYLSLQAAAERAELPQVVEMCQRILPDEERMAQALRENLPLEVTRYLFEDELLAA
jgi:ferritin-like metal-binding protein YciE